MTTSPQKPDPFPPLGIPNTDNPATQPPNNPFPPRKPDEPKKER